MGALYPPRTLTPLTRHPAVTAARRIPQVRNSALHRPAIRRQGRERVVRPHRYAAALVLGLTLSPSDVVEHEVCDNPVCVRAEPDPVTGHVWPRGIWRTVRQLWWVAIGSA